MRLNITYRELHTRDDEKTASRRARNLAQPKRVLLPLVGSALAQYLGICDEVPDTSWSIAVRRVEFLGDCHLAPARRGIETAFSRVSDQRAVGERVHDTTRSSTRGPCEQSGGPR